MPGWGRRLLRGFVALLGCVQFAAAASESNAVETSLIAEVRETVRLSPGQEMHRFVPAAALAQGQVVYYTVRIRNPGATSARSVEVVRRIPLNTVYLEGSAAGPGATIDFSVDGGQTFDAPARLTVIRGGTAPRPATAEDYTHIRWRLRQPLAPAAVALARFQAVFR